MHEFLLLVLKNPNATDTYKPNWRWAYSIVLGLEENILLIIFSYNWFCGLYTVYCILVWISNLFYMWFPLTSVKDTVVSYMERKYMDVPPDVEEFFPDEILLAQYIEAWKFSILLKQERMQR